jgi:hypothetical protein
LSAGTKFPEAVSITGRRPAAPQHAQPEAAELEDEELDAGDDEDDPDAGAADRAPKGPRVFAASIGLSVLLPPEAQGRDEIQSNGSTDPSYRVARVRAWRVPLRRSGGEALRCRDGEGAHGGGELVGAELRAGRRPELWCQLQVPLLGPVGQHS